MRSLISLSLLLAVFSCKLVTQPPTLTGKTGQSLRLTCRTSGFDHASYGSAISWYRQLPGKQREILLISTSSSPNSFVSLVGNRFTVVREDNNNIFDLIIKSARVEDTATYYYSAMYHCALSLHHSDTHHRKPRTITLITAKAGKQYSAVSERQCN
uniref:Ig-like domain-containing protein n=1 Tax=Callorhinchus milii TaxID=7868 RepID=A0A4W3IS88_CALMI